MTEKYKYDFGKVGGNSRFFPEEFIGKAFLKFPIDAFHSEEESFPGALYATLPFKSSKASFSLTSGLFDPVSKLLPSIEGKVGVIRPSPVSVAGAVPFLNVQEIETYLSENRARLGAIIVKPDVSEPFGTSMSVNDRGWLAELAKKHGFVVFEDGSGRALSFLKKPLPPIRSFDEEGESVIYLSDLSEELFSGLGLGLFSGPEKIAKRVAILSKPSVLARHLCLEWALLGGSESFRQTAVPEYKRRTELAIELIESEFPKNSVAERPSGGYRICLKIGEAKAALSRAREQGINFSLGEEFFPENPGKGADLAVLNVGAIPERDIVRGLRRISTDVIPQDSPEEPREMSE